jgi:hypothetical protein
MYDEAFESQINNCIKVDKICTSSYELSSIQNLDNSWTSEPNTILWVSINIDVLIVLFTNPSMNKSS